MKKRFSLLFAVLLTAGTALHGAAASVKASSFGFNAADATECLQKAINSGARTVIIDNVGKPWNIRPVKLRSNLILKVEDNVTVIAKKGEFKGKGDTLFSAEKCRDLQIIGGKNSVFKMRKKDYQDKRFYLPAEWRTILSLNGTVNVTVKNMTLASSGGDGIYICNKSRNTLIENCIIDDNHRQGISIINAIGVTIRKCVISNTFGTEPQAGIDCEVNHRTEYQQNIVVEDTVFRGNGGGGFVFASVSIHPISVVLRNCTFDRDYLAGIMFARGGDARTKGTFLIENCTINAFVGNYPKWYAGGRPCTTIPLYLAGAGAGLYDITVKNLTINAPDRPLTRRISPFTFIFGGKWKNEIGKMTLENVRIKGFKDVPPVMRIDPTGNFSVQNITGVIDFNGKKIDMPAYIKKQGLDRVTPLEDLSKNAGQARVASLALPPVFPEKSAPTTVNPKLADLISENKQLLLPGLHRPEMRSNFKLFFLGKKGMKTTMRCNFFASIYERWPVKAFLTNGKGSTINLGTFKTGINEFSFTWPGDDIYMLHFISRGSRFKLIGGTNLFTCFGQTTRNNKATNMFYLPKRYTGYFEVPANVKEFSLGVSGSLLEATSCEIRNAEGKVVWSKKQFEDYQHLKFTRKSSKREIWSFTFIDAVEDVNIRFYKPLNGIWAEDPACLPVQK